MMLNRCLGSKMQIDSRQSWENGRLGPGTSGGHRPREAAEAPWAKHVVRGRPLVTLKPKGATGTRTVVRVSWMSSLM